MRALLVLAALCSGCALAPNTIRPELEHISHLTQHFGSNQTRYGADIVSVVAHWDTPHHTFIEIGEGIDIDKRTQYKGEQQCGEIMGPREQFTARIGYTFTVKK